jgi:ATP-dependent helicase Lhr and Lhr-like helicase
MLKRGVELAASWFKTRRFKPFPFQQAVWKAIVAGESGLLHATTGAGKTYAIWLGALARFANPSTGDKKAPLTVLWITPMRALAADTARALSAPLDELALDFSLGVRTGDTSAAERARQTRRLPTSLITTPESLSLMLARSDASDVLQSLSMVVVDEWHELIGNKRGVQVQLAVARLRRFRPGLIVWGLSATLGNLPLARDVLLGAKGGVLVEGQIEKDILVDTLLPETMERFPWGGHLGIRMLPLVVEEIAASESSLVFLNTRSQAEIWFQSILEARPDWAGVLALHHGSLDKDVRDWVEMSLKEGKLKAVVCTSSLDLGVDFLPVERVLQIGSAKGIARLLQRAGRSGHAPGRASRVTLVPTTAIELLEAAAARDAVAARRVEPREPPDKPLDVLIQHLVTIALGGGFRPDDLLAEVRTAWSFRNLTEGEWIWALDFVTRGGQSLTAYPEYRRVVVDDEGVYRVPDATIAKRHRMSVGTIVADASVRVQYLSGGRIGTVEESFIARLRRGDHFLFAGRLLELVRVHEMTAYVRRAQGKKASVPRWNGGKMPLSSELANAMLARLDAARKGVFDGPEMQKVKPLIQLQMRYSDVPTPAQLLLERLVSREGHHLFVYPIAGRPVHIGMASLIAFRIARDAPATFSMSVNDYGFELLSANPIDWSLLIDKTILSSDNLLEDTLLSLNASELAKRRFREIARISGLVFQGFPGAPRSMKQLQASSSLFFEVFRKHDANNLLLSQAEREVLEQELELRRLDQTLSSMRARTLVLKDVERPTPFAFPLMVERFRETVSTERLPDRIARMVAQLEAAADLPPKRARAAPKPLESPT